MTNQFTVLNTALRSLQSHQKALDTTGHNVANANTEGYSRQRAELTTTRPYTRTARNMPTDAGQVGTGVEVSSINRLRDQFIDGQIRQQNQASGYWEKMSEGLERIELIFNEPSENNLSQAFTDFRDSLQDLTNNPESSAVRETVRQRGQTLAQTFNNLHRQLRQYQESLNGDVNSTVDEINSIFDRIGDLNREIVHTESSGQDANDMRDRRDLLLDELNDLVNVQSHEDSQGNLNISLAGTSMVSGTSVNHLGLEEAEGAGFDRVIYEHTGKEADIRAGELAGIMEVRGFFEDGELKGEIENYIDDLNDMAAALTDEFNYIHESGFDQDGERGREFFTAETSPGGIEDEAQAISLSDNITESVRNIAAGNYSDNPRVARILDFSEENIDENYTYRLQVGEFLEVGNDITFEELSGGEVVGEFSIDVEYSADENGDQVVLEVTEAGEEEPISSFNFAVDFAEEHEEPVVDWEEEEINLPGEQEGELSNQEIYSLVLEEMDSGDLFTADDNNGEYAIQGGEIDNTFNFGIFARGEANISFDPSEGSGSNAALLSDVIDESELEQLDGTSPAEYFQGVISTLGVDGQRAQQMVENNELLNEQLENQRESISGVSLDEEMANMVKYQQGYAAAANVITTTQQNLDTLMGIIR